MADAMPLAAFLERAKLSKHLASLEEVGCTDTADLAEATDEDLTECGLKKMELKRLRRTLAELGFGGSSSSTSLGSAAAAASPVPRSPVAPGAPRSVLNGQFAIERALGRGSFGEVYLVTRARKDGAAGAEMFACKSMVCATLQEANAGLEEVLAMAKNTHPHLVECYKQGIEQNADGRLVVRIIMEYCERGDMEAAIARGVPFSAERVLSWMRHVLSALQFLHESNTVHRDVKPANILLCGAAEVAKLGDLGLASSRDVHSTRSMAGTIPFMAPESFSGTYGVQASSNKPAPCTP